MDNNMAQWQRRKSRFWGRPGSRPLSVPEAVTGQRRLRGPSALSTNSALVDRTDCRRLESREPAIGRYANRQHFSFRIRERAFRG
jgi:hypothetical protein